MEKVHLSCLGARTAHCLIFSPSRSIGTYARADRQIFLPIPSPRLLGRRIPLQVVIALPSPREKRPQRESDDFSGKTVLSGTASAAAGVNGEVSPSMSGSIRSEQHQGGGDGADPDDAKPLMELTYDKLVYAVGTKTGTFGVPGVLEYCYMLKASAPARAVSLEDLAWLAPGLRMDPSVHFDRSGYLRDPWPLRG